ncbi:MAG: endo-1,4-beta-xylanase [Planctomycetota bacterium]
MTLPSLPAACFGERTAARRLLNTSLLASLLAAAVPTDATEIVLNDFNGQGFAYTFDNFNQTVGPNAVRITDPFNGWGGAGFVEDLNLSSVSDGRLVVDLIPQSGNEVGNFTIELIDQIDGSQTQRSGKWSFDVSSLQAGVPTTLVSTTTLDAPLDGIGDFGSLDLSQIRQWQVLGDFGSPDPFDLSFDRIAISNEVAPPDYIAAYPGASPDAAWRAVAETRINANRKADLSVTVRDASGAVVPNATIDVAMQQHEFGFGSAIQSFRLASNGSQHDQYKAKVKELFNVATTENSLKWPPYEGEWGPNIWTADNAIAALDWLNANGVDGRGHVMVWPGESNLPADIRAMLADGDLTPAEQTAVRNRIANHIADISAATNGKLVGWDVVNETRTNNDLMRELAEGDDAITDWFNLAAAATAGTGTDLYINDFGILNSWGSAAVNNRDQYYQTIAQLKADGAAIDGIGFQGHFSGDDMTGPEELWSILDRFAELDLKMQVTEFDINTTNEELQAQYLRDFFLAMFAHEGVSDIIQWGFWEDAHWRPNAALFRSDWSAKPAGQAFLDLVFGEWWTEEMLLADAEGLAALRAFKGDYLVTATAGEASADIEFALTEGGLDAIVFLDLLVGDYNGDSVVDSGDYTVWRDTRGSTTDLAADGNNDGVVDDADYQLWVERFGTRLPNPVSVPEPATLLIVLIGLVGGSLNRRPV